MPRLCMRFGASFENEADLVTALSYLDPEFAARPWIKAKLFDLWLYTNGKASPTNR
jgi:hypothetical protein